MEQREIKFRALFEGVWYYQTLEEMLTITLAAFRNGKHKTQFTGLKDKNGNSIYEGDIVIETINTEFGDDKIKHEVTYNAGAFYPVCMQPSDTFETIGNLYEHPHLLNNNYKI